MKEGGKFCGSCGHSMEEVDHQEARKEAENHEVAATTIQGNATDNQYVEKTKVIGKQFYQFAMNVIKEPFRAGKQATEADKVNGMIAHLLFAFLLPLFTYLGAKSLSNGFIEVPFGSSVIQPFFYLLLFIAIYSGVVFAVGKLMKVDMSYFTVVAKFGALNVVPAAMMLLAVAFSVLTLNTLSTLLFAGGIVLYGASSFVIVFLINAEKKDNQGIDVFYGLVITNVIMVILYVIIGMSVMENIIEQFNYGPLGSFF